MPDVTPPKAPMTSSFVAAVTGDSTKAAAPRDILLDSGSAPDRAYRMAALLAGKEKKAITALFLRGAWPHQVQRNRSPC